jgi:signal recognition particle receptor subunit beta
VRCRQIQPWRYVDLPGHASQRVHLEALKPVAKGIVYVVDAGAMDQAAAMAQELYTLLVDPVLTARRTPVFIAVNKLDAIDGSKASTNDTPVDPVDDVVDKLEKMLCVMRAHAFGT